MRELVVILVAVCVMVVGAWALVHIESDGKPLYSHFGMDSLGKWLERGFAGASDGMNGAWEPDEGEEPKPPPARKIPPPSREHERRAVVLKKAAAKATSRHKIETRPSAAKRTRTDERLSRDQKKALDDLLRDRLTRK